MPRYEVTGSFNGVEIKPTVVEADSVEGARSKAVAKGVKVKSVIPLGNSTEYAWHEGNGSPPPLPSDPPSRRPRLVVGEPGFEQDAAAAFYNRLLAAEQLLKGIYDRLGWILCFVALISLPMVFAILWFFLMLAGAIGAGAAFLRG